MADMHLKAAVVGSQGYGRRCQLGQTEDGVLQLGEQRVGRVRLEMPIVSGRVAAAVDQHIDVGLRLSAPGGEQAVAFFVALGAPMGREVAQAPAVDDLEPVFAAGLST